MPLKNGEFSNKEFPNLMIVIQIITWNCSPPTPLGRVVTIPNSHYDARTIRIAANVHILHNYTFIIIHKIYSSLVLLVDYDQTHTCCTRGDQL
jgi:hypothetical protein